MGLGGGSFLRDRIFKAIESQRQKTVVPGAAEADLTDASQIAARQRAARRMADGMYSTFGISTRGLEGAPGAGLRGPPRAGDDEPIITTMHLRDLPEGTLTKDQLDEAARKAEEERKRRKEEIARDVEAGIIPKPRNLGSRYADGFIGRIY